MKDLSENKNTYGSKDWSTIVVCVAFGVVVGGTISPVFTNVLNTGWGASFETNGQIGDFFGGVLNPVIALLALIWLRRGVSFQETELAETRASLADAAMAQQTQVQISALTALIQAELIQDSNAKVRLTADMNELKKIEQRIDGRSRIYNSTPAEDRARKEENSRKLVLNGNIAADQLIRKNIKERQILYTEKLRSLAPPIEGESPVAR